MTPIQQIQARCTHIMQRIKEVYGIDFSGVEIRFDLRGRCAGKAIRKSNKYTICFNNDMLTRDAFSHVFNNTVPHEWAHLVCFHSPHLGNGHDEGWKKVCLTLGGSGATGHSEEIVYGNGNTYEYTTTNGSTVRVSQQRHRKIQAGAVLTYYGAGKGAVNCDCSYTIVGVSGRTLSAPVAMPVQAAIMPAAAALPAAVQQLNPQVAPLTPTRAVAAVHVPVVAVAGESKASISRRIMLVGYRAGKSYETIIAEMQAANGYDRQLARGTFKANAHKVGIPSTFY